MATKLSTPQGIAVGGTPYGRASVVVNAEVLAKVVADVDEEPFAELSVELVEFVDVL